VLEPVSTLLEPVAKRNRCTYTVSVDGRVPGRAELAEVAGGCACKRVRRTARAVTQLYDETLRPSGLRVTQFTLLVGVALSEPVPITRLADALGLDRTTLARDLKSLTERGLVEITAGADRRMRLVRLTDQGREAIGRAYPLWRQAQARILEGSGPDRWPAMAAGLEEVAALALRS
jgi:DNA-binding MarR family transcriptional regulator